MWSSYKRHAMLTRCSPEKCASRFWVEMTCRPVEDNMEISKHQSNTRAPPVRLVHARVYTNSSWRCAFLRGPRRSLRPSLAFPGRNQPSKGARGAGSRNPSASRGLLFDTTAAAAAPHSAGDVKPGAITGSPGVLMVQVKYGQRLSFSASEVTYSRLAV